MIIQRLYTGGKFSTCVFLSFVMIITFSCKKKPVTTPDSANCIPLLPCNQVGFGYQYDIDFERYYGTPFFNPNNENELLYLKKYTPTYNSSELYTYNLLTNEKQLIYTGEVLYAPKWGQNGWIIFSKSDGNVYKIKSNGEDLTQLTNEGCYHYPAWYFDQDKFVTYSTCLTADILFDANGVPLDTLPKLIGATSSLTQPPYIAINGDGVRFYNYQTNNFDFMYDYSSQVNGSTHSGSIFWTSTSEVLYSNIKGLNKLTIPSLTNVNFKPSCNSKVYLFGSVNSSKTKMIWSRGDYTQINECTLKYKSRIYIMNIDGSDETEVNL